MKLSHIDLNGTKVCFAFTPNALAMVNDLTGKELTDLIGTGRNISLIRTMAWCAVVEGEAIEGRKFDLTETEFWRLVTIPQISEISLILAGQITGRDQKKSEHQEKKPKVLTRKN